MILYKQRSFFILIIPNNKLQDKLLLKKLFYKINLSIIVMFIKMKRKNYNIMKIKLFFSMGVILSGLLVETAVAQTITAPTGQSLTVTNPIDITVAGGNVNVPNDGSFNFGTKKILSAKGTFNVFFGESAGQAIGVGQGNSFIGGQSGTANTLGDYNAMVGFQAGANNQTGSYNTFLGSKTGFNNTSGSYNLFIGTYAGFSNAAGSDNIFIGKNAGYYTTGGSNNTFFGGSAGQSNVSGQDNLFMGNNAGLLSTGDRNTAIGKSAGQSNSTGTDNTYVGYYAQGGGAITNSTAIGSNAFVSTSNTVVLGNNATTIIGSGLSTGNSGLKFANLTSASSTTATSGSNKVLSVDGTGNVILVALAGGVQTTGTNPVAESTWKNQDGYLYNNSTNGVVINGTGLDGNALIVKGGVLSKEVNVKVEGAESWPDYVFKPTYKRMSLEEVEKFISINGHLPNVASATEMAATGNNLNKTDIKLLEKVEELTLYLLDMKKANDAQSAEIQALKKQMSKLRKK